MNAQTVISGKRFLRILLSSLVVILCLWAILNTLQSSPIEAKPAAVTRYVLDAGGVDAGSCLHDQNPCRTVSYALAQAEAGDTIRVANQFSPAVYTGPITITKQIILEGGWNATPTSHGLIWNRPVPCEAFRTVLDAQGVWRVVTIDTIANPTIDCFTITGGDNAMLGGGINVQNGDPIITNNIITGNYGTSTAASFFAVGGGIYLDHVGPTAVISGNLIANNVANAAGIGQGGGINSNMSDAQILSNTIRENRAGLSGGVGGGIAVRGGSPILAGNELLHNIGVSEGESRGGGIYLYHLGIGERVTIEHNLIQDNIASNGTAAAGSINRGGGIYNHEFPATIRDNIIRGNTASPIGPFGEGGGMYLTGLDANSLISGNTLEGNIAGFNNNGRGGGVFLNNSVVTISEHTIFSNAATWAGHIGEGGGLYINGGEVLLQSNTITNNYGAEFSGFPSTADGYGGGIVLSGTVATLENNLISGNRSTNGESSAIGVGGGVYGYLGSLQITGNIISGNVATQGNSGFGGGLYLAETIPTLNANTILDNEAIAGLYGFGGGIRISNCSIFTLTNNIIARNTASHRGSGVAVTANSTGWLAHNTLAENQGVGIGLQAESGSQLTLDNNIIVSHTTGISVTGSGTAVTADYTLLAGNSTNYAGNIVSSHEVAGPAHLLPDYHLGANSTAVDAGKNAGVVTDIDGDNRPLLFGYDIGADEWKGWPLYLPVILRN